MLAEIRQSNDGLMQKLEKLEEKVTSELQVGPEPLRFGFGPAKKVRPGNCQ